jgi:hypothetical protein
MEFYDDGLQRAALGRRFSRCGSCSIGASNFWIHDGAMGA